MEFRNWKEEQGQEIALIVRNLPQLRNTCKCLTKYRAKQFQSLNWEKDSHLSSLDRLFHTASPQKSPEGFQAGAPLPCARGPGRQRGRGALGDRGTECSCSQGLIFTGEQTRKRLFSKLTNLFTPAVGTGQCLTSN